MVNTSWAVVPTSRRRREAGPARSPAPDRAGAGRPVPSAPTPPFRGDGGLYSTVEDYARFVRMLLNDGTLGTERGSSSPASVK